MSKPSQPARFEEQLEQLEEIVARLEDPSVGLEEALELFERGMVLAKTCRSSLEKVEHKVAQLLQETAEEPSAEEDP